MKKVNAYAASEVGGQLKPFEYELAELGRDEVDIKVHYCGICHSDLSMLNNEWGMTQYPFVPGHEIVGEVAAVGDDVKTLKPGDLVGLGWNSASCMHCKQCMDGSHHLCNTVEGTIVGRHGGFADYVRGHWSWAIPLPKGIDMKKAGPLLCGGITVFNPILLAGVKATDRVGVIGIGGLGHMALKFLNKWGCEVIAFSSNPDKKEQILAMGATKIINSREPEELESIAGSLDFILNTTNVTLDWNAYLSALAPKGRFHNVGAVLEPMAIPAFSLIMGEKSVAGSPLGSPALTLKMLEFCVRHDIYPIVEEFPMSKVNEAMTHLEKGKARYRIVLKV
ncbi:NAD(P)-dependent alcohol dehydrogenase [Ancylomarina euxinus]|uniref:alcohol dehydrogenase (NADP(+)) n=1 Tax=Ancylomarina euxinus TaxID=2283627 RepID=A0A425XZM1_9BACT|nr:NAD(P)-dependent alcohol dehydrogenase [Ancylomarina euxinus]MCZ4695535.1 NAD(P)-dependent alcohol dehydrogenase [Ancylomarina euxinus]MUP15648.1 alcohol dehydrogenase catalytic domain-containing protein [Ancylomarina euxinus]RRG20641.1 NAD(P)-dependent alcohol dehydrogenase [Ancylomarina euxinus]